MKSEEYLTIWFIYINRVLKALSGASNTHQGFRSLICWEGKEKRVFPPGKGEGGNLIEMK